MPSTFALCFHRSMAASWLVAGILLASPALAPAAPPWAPPNALFPPESQMARAPGELQQVLLSAMEAAAGVHPGGWRMDRPAVAIAPGDVKSRAGRAALTLRGDAQVPGAKGDFRVTGRVPSDCRLLGVWMYLAHGANVKSAGIQVYDAEGEALFALTDAGWEGWRWIEADLASGDFEQAYPQPDKNGKADFPLAGVHVVWFADHAGHSEVIVDGLAAATQPDEASGNGAIRAELEMADCVEPGAVLTGVVCVTNRSDAAVEADVKGRLQHDPELFDGLPPDPVHGTDHALGMASWTEAEGKRIEEGSLTDGRGWTAAELPWRKEGWTEAFQVVDLGSQLRVTQLGWRSGDANWVWKLDVAASADRRTYTPVAGLQGVSLHKKWGRQELPVPQAFSARFLRLRYHNDGKTSSTIRMPAALSVYDGVEDESWQFPNAGEPVGGGSTRVTVPARSFQLVNLPSPEPPSAGCYLLAVRVKAAGRTELAWRHVFVMPPEVKVSADSRFGLNASFRCPPELLRRLGIGWVRFENMKWPMVSPQPGEYRYDGSVGPWHVPHDEIVEGYARAGIHVLPFLFMTPEYATSAPPSVESHRLNYPPRDPAGFAEFCFQTVARYGGTSHPAGRVQTPDKKSALGRINTWEIWNEPNLNDPRWGAWVGTMDQYFELLRPAAEAIRRADPNAQVTGGGLAGTELDVIDQFRTHTYPDGKRPLDFIDVVNVHLYTGRTAPERAVVDPNADRSAAPQAGQTPDQRVRRLADWRDRHKPAAPLWVTETGYDTAGPRGVSERLQAAWLVRDVMILLAAGADKVFVYRESGSADGLFAASGLVRDDGSLKPSWFTYATLARELDGARDGRRLPHADENVRLYAWECGGQTVLSAWAVEGTTEFNLDVGRATVTDAFGHRRTLEANEYLPLGEFPVYVRDISNAGPVRELVEQSRQIEAERRERLARLAKLQAYLFDFGGTEHVGTIDLGGLRRYTPVVSAEVYDEAKGFGFYPKAALGDYDRHWIGDAAARDNCRLTKGLQFRLRAESGRYRLRVGVRPFGPTGKLTVRNVAGGDREVEVSKDAPVAELDVEATADPLSLEIDQYADLAWVTLIEQ